LYRDKNTHTQLLKNTYWITSHLPIHNYTHYTDYTYSYIQQKHRQNTYKPSQQPAKTRMTEPFERLIGKKIRIITSKEYQYRGKFLSYTNYTIELDDIKYGIMYINKDKIEVILKDE